MSEYELQNLIVTSDTTEGEPTTNNKENENGKNVRMYTNISMRSFLNSVKEELGSKYNSSKRALLGLETKIEPDRVFIILFFSFLAEMMVFFSFYMYISISDRSIPNYDLDLSLISPVFWMIFFIYICFRYFYKDYSKDPSYFFVFVGRGAFALRLFATCVYIICLIVGFAISVPNHPHKEEG